MSRRLRVIAAAALACVVLGTAGCVTRELKPATDRPTTQREQFPTPQAERVSVRLEMGAGELDVSASDQTSDAVGATFVYAPVELEPAFSVTHDLSNYRVEIVGSKGVDLGRSFDRAFWREEWDIDLPAGVPTDLDVTLGAGQGDLDLRGVDLENLVVTQGAGDVEIDLTRQSRDLMVQAMLGAGDVRISVPADVAVRVTGFADGLGDFDAPGFEKTGGAYVNAAYGKPNVPTIDLDVQRGVGSVEIVEAQ